MNEPPFCVHGILLAAGESRRFSGLKQMAQIPQCASASVGVKASDTLIANALDNLRKTELNSHCLMLGAKAQTIIPAIPQGVSYCVVPDWDKGMGHTISQAMKNLPDDTSHVGIFLADQVKLTHLHYNSLVRLASLHPAKIVAAQFTGVFGAPCIFPSQYFGDLLALSGDTGAKSIIASNASNVSEVEMPEAAFDIDTQQDLASYMQFIGN